MRTPILALTILAIALAASPAPMSAQAPAAPAPQRKFGPIVPSFGGVFEVPDATLLPPKDQDLKLRFDVNVGPEPGELNMNFDTVARYLNQHALAGVPRERLKAALIIHGTAGKDTLANEEYRKRFGKDNPNLKLLDELKAAGVQIYLCGQTSAARNLPRNVVAPSVAFAWSAMVAHMALDREGYVLNPF
ncbi:MAG: DsrE family protein [Acidobacteria bacterium]|nr:DsrE family protein [Acidobacteriota bacterium]